MTIDYIRRPRPVPAPVPVPVPVPAPILPPASRPVPRPVPDSPAPARPGYGVAGLAVKLAVSWFAVEAWASGTVLVAVAYTVAALLCWAFVRQALRYSLAVAGMAVIRAAAVRGGRLADPGAVTDPDAAWRQWLDTVCPGCGRCRAAAYRKLVARSPEGGG